MKNVNEVQKFIFIFLVIVLLNQWSNVLVSANDLYVNPQNEILYDSIQDAIDAAVENDTIYVKEGLYIENIIIDKSIRLIGDDKSNTTIDGSGNICIHLQAEGIEIRGFSIINGSYGMYIENSSDNILHDNTIKQSEYGIYIRVDASNSIIYSNNFVDNTVNAFDLSSNNWFYASSGNFWDDYTGVDANNNNLGDSPYYINGSGNQDFYPLMDALTAKPDVDFWYTPSEPTTQTMITFNDISSDPDGTIMSWFWDFGDQTNDTNKNPTHFYQDDGVHLISLTVFDDLGASNTEIYEITVRNVPPTAYFTFSPHQPLDIQEVDFRDDSMDPDGTIIDWTWSVDGKIKSNSSSFLYTFPDDGTYTIKLEIEDDDKSRSLYTEQITVLNVGPTASFTFYTESGEFKKDEIISFNDNSKDLDGTILNWYWDFGDGKTSTDPRPTHTYQNDGSYSVSLTVEDDDGEKESISKYVNIGDVAKNEGVLSGLSIFDLVFVAGIIIAVIFVFILSKKYAF